MVFNDKFSIKDPEEPREGIGWYGVQAEATVARDLGENNILVANPPLVETHRETHELHAEVGHERDTGDIEKLLFGIGVQCQEWIGVLGQVMSPVVFPESVHLVHQPVVPIKPKVENDSVEPGFEGEPEPIHSRRGLAGSIAEEHGEHRAKGGCRNQGVDDLFHADIRHPIPLVLVAIEESQGVAQPPKDVYLMNGDGLEGRAIKDEGGQGA